MVDIPVGYLGKWRSWSHQGANDVATGPEVGQCFQLSPFGSLGPMQAAEPGLVRDLISACQGISSASVAVGADAAGDLTFSVSRQLSRPQRQLMLRLCEFGWLFRRAQASARQAPGIPGTAGGKSALAR